MDVRAELLIERRGRVGWSDDFASVQNIVH